MSSTVNLGAFVMVYGLVAITLLVGGAGNRPRVDGGEINIRSFSGDI